ncbi:MAG TPA: MurR/RpiR family transcriptional regulator [Afifellaceae bacterium]|nr:MurR/RpiR family transcriptional regulator [Afifellaceae bacterium]
MSDSAVIDIISQLRKQDGTFSSQEQKVADHILEDLEAAVHMNLKDIADASKVSIATVNRFCQSLGCRGFKDFKIRLAQNVAVSLQYMRQPIDRAPFSDDLVNYIFDGLLNTLSGARSQLDSETLRTCIDILAHCNRLVVIGVGGGSSNVAAESANRFFRLGISCQAISDGYQQRMVASTMGPEDVLFAISATGWPKELLDSTAIARQYGATTLALTQRASPLAKACDVTIALDNREDGDIYKPSPTRFVFNAVIDVLATGVARSRPNRSRENLRRIRSSLTALHKQTGPHPVGD